MSKDSAAINLTNHFLIAMPAMEDDMFGRSVVYMCEHSDKGALGLVVNKPSGIRIANLFDKVELPLNRADLAEQPVFQGGPVQTERGFVLHDAVGDVGAQEPVYASTLSIPGGLEMTTSRDVLEAVSQGQGPQQLLVTLGCAGWSAGQLEEEILRNGWLTVPADPAIIFETPIESRFVAAMNLLGIDPNRLTGEAGHA